MPNANTFSIKPIREFISRHQSGNTIDPFANSSRIATVTNDLNPEFNTDYNEDALTFLERFSDGRADTVLFDPPYSPRQVSEVYKALDKTVNMETTSSAFWSRCKNAVSFAVPANGVVLSFGWNSNGMGKKRGFEIIEVLIIAHGGMHNDTICVAERRLPNLFD